MKKIRVAIVGLGNCAKSLVEGIALYNQTGQTDGLAFPNIGGYEAKDIEFALAYDVDTRKVNLPIYDAIYCAPNCAIDLGVSREHLQKVCTNTKVRMGAVLDGVADHMQFYPTAKAFRVADNERQPLQSTIVKDLIEHDIDIVLNYLPVGSQAATEFYLEACLIAKVPFVNCIPIFIVSDPIWEQKIKDAGIPAIGDDMRSAIGASIISAVLQDLFLKRGAKISMHYQDNVGGNTDFLNMQDQERLKSKKISKENVIKKQNELHGVETEPDTIAAGPAKYFPDLKDNKRAHWLIRGTIFGGAEFEFTADLSCQDSPNSAGVVVDAIRFLKVAHEMGMVGSLHGPSSFTQKTPIIDLDPAEAYNECVSLSKREWTSITKKYNFIE